MIEALHYQLTMKNIEELAEYAEMSVSDLFDDDEWDDFRALPAIEKIKWRYSHADCDDIAVVLHRALGWPVVSVSSPKGLLHRLVQSPSGMFLDIHGWVDMAGLKQRYKSKQLKVSPPGGEELCHTCLDDDELESFQEILAALLQIGVSPFNDTLRPQLLNYGLVIELDTGVDCSTENTGYSL